LTGGDVVADDFNMRIDWSGFEDVKAALRQAKTEVLKALTQGMIENTEDLLGRGMRDAPIDEGNLRGSGSARVNRGKVAVSEMQADEDGKTIHSIKQVQGGADPLGLIDLHGNAIIEGEVGFNEPYAAQQHEHTEYKHPQGGKAKYLEDPLKEMTPRYIENLANHVREVTKGG
jgi:hypothetical protein